METGCMIEKHGSQRMHSQVRFEVTSPDFINLEKLLKQWKELLLGMLRSGDFRLRQDGSIT